MNNSKDAMFWIAMLNVVIGIIFSFRNFNKSLGIYSLLDSKGNNGNFYKKEGQSYYNHAANWFIFTIVSTIIAVVAYLIRN